LGVISRPIINSSPAGGFGEFEAVVHFESLAHFGGVVPNPAQFSRVGISRRDAVAGLRARSL